MTDFIILTSVMGGLRLFSLTLSMAIIFFWTPSFLRVLRGAEHGRDPARAIWVTLAIAVFLFQIRWLYPGLADLTRMRLWVVAQAAMSATLVAAIYHHGIADERFNIRRTMIAHSAMLALCILFAGFVR